MGRRGCDSGGPHAHDEALVPRSSPRGATYSATPVTVWLPRFSSPKAAVDAAITAQRNWNCHVARLAIRSPDEGVTVLSHREPPDSTGRERQVGGRIPEKHAVPVRRLVRNEQQNERSALVTSHIGEPRDVTGVRRRRMQRGAARGHQSSPRRSSESREFWRCSPVAFHRSCRYIHALPTLPARDTI